MKIVMSVPVLPNITGSGKPLEVDAAVPADRPLIVALVQLPGITIDLEDYAVVR